MSKELSLFERYLFTEAPDETPPDVAATSDPGPPDIPDGAEDQGGPPDLPGDDMGSDDGGPPDIGGGDDDSFGGGFEDGDTGGAEDSTNEELELDDKVSAIMNMNLYQRYLTLLNTIGSQLTMIKNNSDILYTISTDSLDIIESLKKLDENIRLYLSNYFLHENYSKNLLFFNKCLNLLKLLNDLFDGSVQKGIKSME